MQHNNVSALLCSTLYSQDGLGMVTLWDQLLSIVMLGFFPRIFNVAIVIFLKKSA